MKVYALVGESGSGKSHRAPWIAKQRNIEYIIDDGLLIKGNTVLCGHSAKKEKTRIASVKTAVFVDDDRAFEVSHALKNCDAKSVLILGTSDGMVKRIAERLGFDGIDEIIHITDIATPEEIQQALMTRRSQGKHVIPVPTMELKKDFSGIYLDPLNILKKTKSGYIESPGEKSVVRPTFSYLGNFTISEHAIYQLMEHVALESPGVAKISRFRVESAPGGITMEIDLVLKYGYKIPELMSKLHKSVVKEIENFTSLNVRNLKLTAKSVIPPS
ncbi:MAG: Asp23/Gls24 family envelope stress response protein [Clostridia bacterium]|nr:Asp23/Gls24 family envelope stress response protein [Clostridia bacterium]